MQAKQSFFDQDIFKSRKDFGGALIGKGHAKKARPISTQHAMHVVLRSSKAKGDWSLHSPRNLKLVERTLKKLAHQFGITIYRYAIVSNHIHILLKLSNRFTFAPFMRALAGTIALKVTGANKLKALTEKFWDFIPWSRVVEWGKAYTRAKAYVFQNELEACGDIPYQPRGKSPSRRLQASPA
jgi:REP element-mobilizing transposase RayT